MNCGESYIDSLDWTKIKKATINLINKKDSKCFQYAVTVTLNCEKIKKSCKEQQKIKPFINKYSWEGINFPSEKDDWKRFEKNNIKKKKYILLLFQNITQIMKNKLFL